MVMTRLELRCRLLLKTYIITIRIDNPLEIAATEIPIAVALLSFSVEEFCVCVIPGGDDNDGAGKIEVVGAVVVVVVSDEMVIDEERSGMDAAFGDDVLCVV